MIEEKGMYVILTRWYRNVATSTHSFFSPEKTCITDGTACLLSSRIIQVCWKDQKKKCKRGTKTMKR